MKVRSLLTTTVACAALTIPAAKAVSILGTGTGALLGGDLTDPEDDGTAAGANFEATFFATDKPDFTTNQSAFKIFTNTVVNDQLGKYCCGGGPQTIGATFSESYVITHFTLASSGDSPGRDPDVYALQGSNDTTDGIDGTWADIYNYSMDDGSAPNTRFHAGNSQWTDRNQVLRFDGAGDDFATPAAYSSFRLTMTSPAGWVGGGGQLALAEMELFGTPIPEPSSAALVGLAGLGLLRRRR
jgi:hypothetical protein